MTRDNLSEINTEDEDEFDDEIDDEEEEENAKGKLSPGENEEHDPVLLNPSTKKRKISLLPRQPRAKLDSNRYLSYLDRRVSFHL